MQLDEKWAFVRKKQKNCHPEREDDREDKRKDEREDEREDDLFVGDQWDHVAYDPQHRLVLALVVGKRVDANAEMLLEQVKARLGGRCPALITSDGYPAYEGAILEVFGEWVTPPATGQPGRPALPRLEPPEDLCYGRVVKRRVGGRVVSVEEELVFGTEEQLIEVLRETGTSTGVSTSHLERCHGTDRHRNARKVRKSYRFSKKWEVHVAMSAFTLFSSNFCWPVRTLRQKRAEGGYQARTPAMAAGLADHVWSIEEWLTLPARQH